MGLLLLLTYTLLSSYALTGTWVDAQRNFAIRSIKVIFEPSNNVSRGTNVTVKCLAEVISPNNELLTREYTIYKDNEKVYTKNSSSPEVLQYPLPDARVSNSGKYMCVINMKDKEMKSEAKKLTVTGLSRPVLHIYNRVVNEGDEVMARCEAPNETGSIFFYFYEGSKVIMERKGSSNHLEAKLSVPSFGTHKIHCTYTVLIIPESFKSQESDTVDITVKELSTTPVLEIYPGSNIYEGDHLNITCTIKNPSQRSKYSLLLSQGTQLLSTGETSVKHSMTALSTHPGDFECRLEIESIEKVATKHISVTELFSVPKLTVSPSEFFQKDNITITCKSDTFASERISSAELTYSLRPSWHQLTQESSGVFSGKATQHEQNYTCVAQTRGITKSSEILTIRPKVSVSTPEISVLNTAVVGEPFKILCQSTTGSFPITYSLLKNDKPIKSIIVELPPMEAIFQATLTSAEEINNYTCQAINRPQDVQKSKRLTATVIVPLTKPSLIIHPKLTETYEGNELLLICAITGSPPVTYIWYRNGNKLKTNTSNQLSMDYHFQRLNKEDSGSYHCEAANKANRVRSDTVTVEVLMAIWKRALIGGVCVLVLIVMVVFSVLYFKSQRGKREAAPELSVKPSSPKSDDSLTENLTHNTEVYNAATGAVSLYDGIEGRVTNGTRDSVAFASR